MSLSTLRLLVWLLSLLSCRAKWLGPGHDSSEGFHFKDNDDMLCSQGTDHFHAEMRRIINETGTNIGCPSEDPFSRCQLCKPFEWVWERKNKLWKKYFSRRPNYLSGFGDAFWMNLSIAQLFQIPEGAIIDHSKLHVVFYTQGVDRIDPKFYTQAVERLDVGVQFVNVEVEGGRRKLPYDFKPLLMVSKTTSKVSNITRVASFSVSCFPKPQAKHGLRVVNLMSPNISLFAQAKYNLVEKGTKEDTVTLGLLYEDIQMLTFNVEDNGAELERIRFKVEYDPSNSSDRSQQLLRADRTSYLQAFVFTENSSCIQEFIRHGACVPGQQLLPCLRNVYDRNRSKAWIGTHISFLNGTQVTLSAASQPARSPGRWFVLFTCSGHVFDGSGCREASITLTTTSEFALWTVLRGTAFMFFGPIAMLVFIGILYTTRSNILRKRMAGTPLEHIYESNVQINFDMAYWRDLPTEICKHLQTPQAGFDTQWLIILVLFFSTAGQFALAQWDDMHALADRDKCFYNELCYYPWGSWSVPLNNLLSHFPYLLSGLFLSNMVHGVRKRIKFDARPFYAIAVTVCAEGVGSAFYHICPSMNTFQFDTCFMIPISHMCCTALVILPDRGSGFFRLLNKYILYMLAPIWSFNFIGTRYDVGHISWSNTFADRLYYVIFMVVVMVWIVNVVQCFDRLFFVIEHKPPDNFPCCKYFRLGLKGMCILLIGACTIPDIRKSIGGMANAFLLCSISVMMVVNGWQAIALDSQDGSLYLLVRAGTSNIFIKYFHVLIALVIVHFALKCFYLKVALVEPDTNAATSHNANQNCVFSIFDLHDLWHLLSGLGLFMWITALFDIRTRHAERYDGETHEAEYLRLDEYPAAKLTAS